MATAVEIIEQVKAALTANTNALASQKQSFELLTLEVKKLIEQGDLAGATALLEEIANQHAEIVAAAEANTELAAAVDAANG